MELSTDLVVKIVVLLTAIVGLYRVANFETAKPFIEYFLAAISILIIPTAMFGFIWIMNAMTHVMDRPVKVVTFDGPDAEVMYKISQEFWDQKMRQEALKLAIERAFQTKQWAVVVKASEDLNPTSQRDQVLMRAVRALTGQPDAVPNAVAPAQ